MAVKDYALELGFDTVGVCAPMPPPHFSAYKAWLDKGYQGTMSYLDKHLPLKADPAALLPGVQSIVAVTLNYYQDPGDLKIARYALGRDYHKVMRAKLRKLAAFIEQAHPGAKCRPCVDSAPIMERDYAQLAGLGWFGKNTMLIDSRRGSWFFIGLLLTTVEFEQDSQAVGGCGSCHACIDACPTGAIVYEEERWQVDARSCISYLTIEHEGEIEHDTAGWVFGCDICQEVCPFNQPRASQPLRSAVSREPGFLGRREWPSLERLAMVSDSDWDELTQGSAVRRAGAAGLRRNAKMALARDCHPGSELVS